MAPEPAILFTVLILAALSSARDLRPSDHGLIFQTLSPASAYFTPEMKSFFNADKSSPSTSSSVALPRTMNYGDATPPSWRRSTALDGGGDRLGKALMAVSVVCGIAGVVLLVASVLIYMYKNPKQELNAAFRSENGNDGENNEDNNKLQLVVHNS
ncbi:hypothetical protein TanjilG_24275 [Lupinus angustifolius]|uniref:Uncharacterized protein n=1 Tax=Lupinus angustifolius TaxID=3871 RepID=A0A1J7HDU3_LUPAN|nr:PREDICTED: uncharacterized protein LOC109362666 [Lupinus angustifolius]OIW00545.1 hypothetical protein TanjilG_24275 [Lupinus angustifolius]